MRSRVLPAYLWMLYGSLAFALMGELAHALRSCCSWQLVALDRSVLGLVLAVSFTLAGGNRLVLWRPRVLWMRSCAGGVSLLCNFYALTHLPVADALTLTNTFPLWVALLSWPLLGERPPGRVWLAVGTAVLGVALVEQPHVATGNLASLVALLAGLSTAVAMIGLHRLEGIAPWAIVAHFAGVSVLFCLASVLLFGQGSATLAVPGGWPLALLLAVGVTASVGQLFLTRAFAAGSPARVAVVGLSQVVWAMGLDMLLWNRAFSPWTLLGVALVLGPAAWVMAGHVGEAGKDPPRNGTSDTPVG